MTKLEAELSELIVDALDLTDVSASDIDPDGALFGDGLGLDSVDALELAIAVHKHFGVQLKAEDAGTREAFSSLKALAAHIETVRGRSTPPAQ